jgi:cytoskeletal protein RodZ
MPENFATFLATHQWVIILAAAWTIPWKGVALWRAAKKQSVAWFIVLLLVNTLGILDIIYVFAFSKRKDAPTPVEPQKEQKTEKGVLDVKTEETKSEIDNQDSQSPEKVVLDVKMEETKPELDEKSPES